MAKDKGKKKRKKDKQSAQQHSVPAGQPWVGEEYDAEIDTIKMLCMRLREVPIPGSETIPGGFSAEGVALALARTHTRLALLVGSWKKSGCPADDAAAIRMVRADMRVLAEISITMMTQLLSLADGPVAGGSQ